MDITMKDYDNALSLADIFLDNGNSTKAIKVQQVRHLKSCEFNGKKFLMVKDRVPMFLMGIDKNEQVAFCYTDKTPNKIIRRSLDKIQWVVWRENELVPHYQAIYKYSNKDRDGYGYCLSKTLYSNDHHAMTGLGSRFVRLATESPMICLPKL